jgi:antitoxin PrlF
MSISTLTTKGQVTIPKDIRELLHLHCGDKIEFFVKQNGEATIRPISKKVDEVFGMLQNISQKSVSVEQMNEAIESRFKGKYL